MCFGVCFRHFKVNCYPDKFNPECKHLIRYYLSTIDIKTNKQTKKTNTNRTEQELNYVVWIQTDLVPVEPSVLNENFLPDDET